MYELHREDRSAILEISITGFWNYGTFSSFKSDVEAAVAEMTARVRNHSVLIDVSAIAIQSQAIFESFRQLIENEDPRPVKIAFYAPTALSRMQSRRLQMRDDIRVYAEKAAALNWLLA